MTKYLKKTEALDFGFFNGSDVAPVMAVPQELD